MLKKFTYSTVISAFTATLLLTGCSDDDNTSNISVSQLTKIGSYETGKEGGSEIVAYSEALKRAYITNGEDNTLDIVDISDPSTPTLFKSVDLSPYGTGVNSVAVKQGVVAVAIQNGDSTVGKKQLQGSVEFFDEDGKHTRTVKAGFLPDMVTFNEDGTKVIVANEGEPNGSYTVDPVGSIGIVTVSNGSYVDLGFSSVTLTSALDGTAVRLGATPSNDQAKDLEPEYITVSGNYAYVTLQENNAMAKVDLSTNTIEYVKSYGAKSYASGNMIDIEENEVIDMKHFSGLYGLYQPDSIASYEVSGQTYIVTANEGDGREYLYTVDAADEGECDSKGGDWDDGECLMESHVDEKKINKLDLDSSIAADYADDDDLKVMVDLGDSNSDGVYEKLYTYGARSFSIWNAQGDLVWDSGDEISKKVAELQPDLFNQDEGEMDGRSGNKGAEPEALTVGKIGSKTYAFVGLERQNVIMTYDITDPQAPMFVHYMIAEEGGDISPEGMRFISSENSPNGKNLLLVSYEVSGSTVVYEIQ